MNENVTKRRRVRPARARLAACGVLWLASFAGRLPDAAAFESARFVGQHALALESPSAFASLGLNGFVLHDAKRNTLVFTDAAFAVQRTVPVAERFGAGIRILEGLVYVAELDRIFVLAPERATVFSLPINGETTTPIPLSIALPDRLTKPQSLAVDPRGRLYIGDRDDIKVFALDGTYLFAIQKPAGQDKAAKFRPGAMTVLRDGSLAVTESGSDQLLVLGREGDLRETIPLEDAPKRIDALIALESGDLLGFDGASQRVYKWTSSGRLAGTFGAPGNGRGMFGRLADLVPDAQGNLAALDALNRSVQVFAFPEPLAVPHQTPRFAYALGRGESEPAPLPLVSFIDGGAVYFDAAAKAAVVVRGDSRQTIQNAAFTDLGAAMADAPYLCFFDRHHRRVFVHDERTGAFVVKFGELGNEASLKDVRRMLPGGKDTWYLADAGANKIHLFSRDGLFLASVGDKGDNLAAALGRVSDMLWVGDELAVLDGAKSRIHFYDASGRFARNVYLRLEDRKTDLRQLGLGPNNALLVLDAAGHRVWIVDDRGNMAFCFGSGGAREADWITPTAFAVDAQGNIRLRDAGPPARIVHYALETPGALARAELAVARHDWNAAVGDLNAYVLRLENATPLADPELDQAILLAVEANTASQGRILFAPMLAAAENYLRKLLQARPDDERVRIALAQSLKWNNRTDEAIMLLQAGRDLDPANERIGRLQKAYTEELVKDGSNRTFVRIDACEIPVLFAALHHTYFNHPVITLKLSNLGPAATRPGKASFFAKGIMDGPTDSPVPVLEPFSTTTLAIPATFNRNALSYVESTHLAAEIVVQAGYGADELTLTKALTFELRGRNSVDWNQEAMIASFITPKDPDVQAFMRQVMKTASGRTIHADLDTHLYRAVALFDALQSVGIYYQPDPRQPFQYADFAAAGVVDYVQHPRETLLRKSGDCDDLAVLFAALLESSGVPTILVTSPGHIFTALQTENGKRCVEALGLSPDLLLEYNGEHYIPVETTMVDSPFVSAWRVAASTIARYQQEGKIGFIDMADAWKRYAAISLPPSEEAVPLPPEPALDSLMQRELDALNLKQIEKRMLVFKRWLEDKPDDLDLLLFLARSYGEVGILDEAQGYAERAVKLKPEEAEVHQTLGNLAYLRNDTAAAVQHFAKANALKPSAALQVNLALAYLKEGKLMDAREAYRRADEMDQALVADYPELGSLLK